MSHENYSRNSGQSSGFGSTCLACKRRSQNETYWRRRYGMSRSQVDQLRRAQSDRCAICGDQSPEHLDHDHGSGKIRSLLCQRCNFGLGLYRDDPELLRAAADYVEEHRDEQRLERPRPLAQRRQQVSGRVGSPPVGSRRRPPGTRRTDLCSRGRALPAAREVDG
ncbi:endonuclease domain-containing protein [Modestobacter altitudinis]|uniref:endonuclease domain-containing protein n=1 Tax=Modestobacter altitudinis TaxID=2213158 RepID=UPI0034E060C3